MSDKALERRVMSTTAEASSLLRQIAGNGEPGETKKAAWLRAYRRVSRQMSFNRVCDLWRQDPRARVSGDELVLLRDVASRFTKKVANDDLGELRKRIERLESLLLAKDPDLHREVSGSLRNSAARLGDADASPSRE